MSTMATAKKSDECYGPDETRYRFEGTLIGRVSASRISETSIS